MIDYYVVTIISLTNSKNIVYYSSFNILENKAGLMHRWFVWIFIMGLSVSSYAFDTTKTIFHFHGPTNGAEIGIALNVLGDINSDGFDDIIVSSNNPFGSYIFYGSDPIDSLPDMFISGYSLNLDPIDLDGDGINEVITSYNNWWDKGGIYFYKGYQDSISSVPYDSIIPLIDNFGFGWRVKTGYVDSDSLGDIVTYKANTLGGPTLLYYSGCPTLDTVTDWTYKVENYTHIFSDFGFIDYDGDGQLDIYLGMSADLDTLSFIYIFYGLNFSNQPDVIIGHPSGFDWLGLENFVKKIKNIGDIDGDGWEDLGVLYHNRMFIYLCGPSADTLFDYYLDGDANELNKAGDINGDGYNDLLSGDSRTFNGVVDVYLGGPEFDQHIDMSIYRQDLPSLFLEHIGFELSPAGDFNGDGNNDFLFSCRNYDLTAYWDVFMVSGGSYIVTDVKDEQFKALPEKSSLYQNFPNPFNPETTISFDISNKSEVTLKIYNILGKEVKTLLNKQLPAGSYNLEWDGADNAGNLVSSGIYFYNLTSDNISLSKKMVLLK